MNQRDRKQIQKLADELREVFAETVQPVIDRLEEFAEAEQEKAEAFMGTNLEESERVQNLQTGADQLFSAMDEVTMVEDALDTAAGEIENAMEVW